MLLNFHSKIADLGEDTYAETLTPGFLLDASVELRELSLVPNHAIDSL